MPIYARVGEALQYMLTASQARKRHDLVLMKDVQPSPDHIATASGEWVLSREKLLTMINEEKNRRRDSGFMLDGTLWDSDNPARLAYAEVAGRFVAESSFTAEWKASAGVWVTLDKALFERVYAAGAAHLEAAYAWQKAKEEELAATPDAELGGFIITERPEL